MRNTKRKQKGGFFNIGGNQTKSQRELMIKCDSTDVQSINDVFLLKSKISRCCPSSFGLFAKNKSIKCNEMNAKYEELIRQGKKEVNINNINDSRYLEKMYLSSCPKDSFGFKRGSPLCRQIEDRHRKIVSEENLETRHFQNEYGKPKNRLSNLGRNIINTFNNPPQIFRKTENSEQLPEHSQEHSSNEEYNSEFKRGSNTQEQPVEPTQPEQPLQPEEPSQQPNETPRDTTRGGGKRIKRKSKRRQNKNKNKKTKRR